MRTHAIGTYAYTHTNVRFTKLVRCGQVDPLSRCPKKKAHG